MTGHRAGRSYRHEAFLHRGAADFLDGALPFVREGVAAGEPVMVALRPARSEPLREALGADAAYVRFVDMVELGRNPALIIAGWHGFLDEHCRDVRPVRGLGEPVWAGRRPYEIAEGQLHDALLNLAVDPDTPFWLRCPYDVGALSAAQVAEVARSHPVLVDTGGYAGSRSYGGRQHAEDLFAAALPAPAGATDDLALPAERGVVARLVTGHAAAAGLDGERSWAVSVAVREVAAAVRAGGTLRVWIELSALVCEVHDPEPLEDPLAGRRRPVGTEPDPLWLANQMCDLVQVRTTDPGGTTVRLVTWR